MNNRKTAMLVLTSMIGMFPTSALAKRLEDDQLFESILQTWTKGLDGLTEADVLKGLEGIQNSGNEFPPGLPVFIAACKAGKPFGEDYAALPPPSEDHRLASITGLPVELQDELIRLGLKPMEGETVHEHAIRCKKHRLAATGKTAEEMVPHE